MPMPTEIETPHDSWRKLTTHPLLQGMLLLAIALAIALWIQVPDRFPDPDSFYHAAMGELAREQSFPTTFPWAQLTTLRDAYADLHFGYHLFLVPFQLLFGTLAGLRIATIVSVGFLALAFWSMLRAFAVRGAFAFTLLLLGGAGFLFRVNLAKAQGVAFIILFLGLIAVAKRSKAGVLLATLFATWVSSHWPVLVLAVGTHAAVHIVTTLTANLRTNHALRASIRRGGALVGSAILGVAGGLIVNPYFPNILSVAKLQIIDIALVNGIAEANVGIEWGTISASDLFSIIGYLAPLALLAIGGTIALAFRLAQRGQPEDRDALAASLTFALLTVAFTGLTLQSQRHIEFLVPLATAFIALGWQPFIGWMWPPRIAVGWRRPGMVRRPLFTALVIVSFLSFGLGAARAIEHQRERFVDGFPTDHLRGAAVWVRDHVPAGEIVFHGDWDDFPFLFLHDRTHRYLIGLDPRFAFLEDAGRFRAWARIARGDVPPEVIAQRIIAQFGATTVLVARQQDLLTAQLRASPDATIAYEDADATVFRLTP